MSLQLSATIIQVLKALGFAAIGAGGLWLVLILPFRLVSNVPLLSEDIFQEIGLLFFSSILGLVLGIVTGLSREAALSSVVPAILTLIGAFIGYIFSGKFQLDSIKRLVIISSAIALTIFFYGGALEGSEQRLYWDAAERSAELDKMKYASDLEIHRKRYEAELEKVRMKYQTQLDLVRPNHQKSHKPSPK